MTDDTAQHHTASPDDGATPPFRVVVIGATGNVGLATMRALSADPAVTSVVGVARRSGELALDTCSWVEADISCDSLDFVAGADAVIHLAWKIQPQRDEDEMRATNVDGTRRVVDAVIRHGVPRLVVASSVGTYGPGPKLAPVDESWSTAGTPTSIYSRHKAEVEAMLDRVSAQQPNLVITRMRTSLVMQRAAASEIHRLFLGPLPWGVPRFLRLIPSTEQLTVQVTHADDIADAYRRAVHSDVGGAFNVAAEPPLTPAVIARAVGGRPIRLPVALVRAAAAVAYRLHLQPSEPGWIDMAANVPTMDTSRIRSELGWQETHSSMDALLELFDGIGNGAGGPTPPLHPRRRRRLHALSAG